MESQRTVPTREVTRLCWVLAAEEALMVGGSKAEEAEEAKRVSYDKKNWDDQTRAQQEKCYA